MPRAFPGPFHSGATNYNGANRKQLTLTGATQVLTTTIVKTSVNNQNGYLKPEQASDANNASPLTGLNIKQQGWGRNRHDLYVGTVSDGITVAAGNWTVPVLYNRPGGLGTGNVDCDVTVILYRANSGATAAHQEIGRATISITVTTTQTQTNAVISGAQAIFPPGETQSLYMEVHVSGSMPLLGDTCRFITRDSTALRISAGPDYTVQWQKPLADSAPTSDVLDRQSTYARALADASTLSDSLDHQETYRRTLQDEVLERYALDSGPSALHGRVRGIVTVAASPFPDPATALDFNSALGHIEVGNDLSLGVTKFVVEARVKFLRTGAIQDLYGRGVPGQFVRNFRIGVNGAHRPFFTVHNVGGGSTTLVASGASAILDDGAEVELAYQYSLASQTGRIFINGVQFAANSMGEMQEPTTEQTTLIGKASPGSGGGWQGIIAGLRHRNLAPYSVAGYTPTSAPFDLTATTVGLWQMDDLVETPFEFLSRLMAYQRNSSDSIPLSDALERSITTFRELLDDAPTADVLDRTISVERELADAADPVTDSLDHIETYRRTLQESIPVTDDLERLMAYSRELADAAPTTDELEKRMTYARKLEDSLGTGGTTIIRRKKVIVYDRV